MFDVRIASRSQYEIEMLCPECHRPVWILEIDPSAPKADDFAFAFIMTCINHHRFRMTVEMKQAGTKLVLKRLDAEIGHTETLALPETVK